jgi:hypothetical protein
MEKRINDILENSNYDEHYCHDWLCENGLIPDWYIIYTSSKDKNEETKLVEYYFKEIDK